jgi:hypothetical protein
LSCPVAHPAADLDPSIQSSTFTPLAQRPKGLLPSGHSEKAFLNGNYKNCLEICQKA